MNQAQFPVPVFASWESTSRCNMECHHCGVSSGPHAEGLRGRELSTLEAMRMMEQLVELGVKRLVISGGEFTTRKDWKELLVFALQHFEMVRQISNGWLGTPLVRVLEIMPNIERLVLSLSLDGMWHTHDANRRAGSYARVVDILRAPSTLFRTAITTVLRSNFLELDAIFHMLCNFRIPVWSLQLGLPEGRMQKEMWIGEENAKILADKIVHWQVLAGNRMEVIPDNCFGYGHAMRAAMPWQGCQAGKNLITILSGGDVTGCPTQFHFTCGNLRDVSLMEIWQGMRMQGFRTDLPVCDACENRACGGGCRAVQQVLGAQLCF